MAHPTAHGTLVADTVSTTNLTVPSNLVDPILDVVNRSADQVIWYTLDGTTPVASTEGSFWIGAGMTVAHPMTHRGSVNAGEIQVKLLSTGTPTFSLMVR